MSYSHFKRLPVKYVRDKIKSKYKEREPCYICGSEENIELHHIYSISELWNSWCRKNKIKIDTEQDVINCRLQFEEDMKEYLNNEHLYSLCKSHHQRLHSIFGKSYSNYIGKKVESWLEKQRLRYRES